MSLRLCAKYIIILDNWSLIRSQIMANWRRFVRRALMPKNIIVSIGVRTIANWSHTRSNKIWYQNWGMNTKQRRWIKPWLLMIIFRCRGRSKRWNNKFQRRMRNQFLSFLKLSKYNSFLAIIGIEGIDFIYKC